MADFAVWAPLPSQVRLDVDGSVHPMTRGEDDWWRTTVDCTADARYGFVLDDDPTVLPDGITLSDDPVLAARAAVYSQSYNRREDEIARGLAPEATGRESAR